MKQASAILLLALLPLLAACSQASVTPAGTATSQEDAMEIIELPELQPYAGASVKGDSSVTWTPVTSSPEPPADAASKAVQAAIIAQASRLASIDYSALSMPAFVTVTASLKPAPQDFTGDQLRIDSAGDVSGAKRWALYSWQGPKFPPLQSRTQVVRWVQVYALYDLTDNRVVRLIATVRGEVGE
jgi:hypothetical protein